MNDVRRAVTWWNSLRPTTWDLEAHLRHPAVGTRTREEGELALEVAAYLMLQRDRRGRASQTQEAE